MNSNTQSIKRPYDTREIILQAFQNVKARPHLDLYEYRCTSVGRWLEFKVVLHGGYSFLMYFGLTRKVLSHCRRMCRTGRRYVQGVTVTFKETAEDIALKITNCIMAVRQAFSCGNRKVVDLPDDAFQPKAQPPTVPDRPMLRTSMSFA